MVSYGVRKLVVFKSMGPSGIQSRVLKEITGTLSNISGKNGYWVRSLMTGKKVTICPSLRKMRIQKTID